MDNVREQLLKVKKASRDLMSLLPEERKQVLLNLAANIRQSKDIIIQENQKDLALMAKEDPRYDRLLLSNERIEALAHDVETVAHLANPLGQVLEEITRPNGLKIQKLSVPLGVVAVIYESRPNVTVDVFSLCFKTGNACVLKGGKESLHSNTIFVAIIQQTLQSYGIDRHIVYLLNPERTAMQTLLGAIGLVDVCIPRGGQKLINFVREHARIPVIETGAGIVHTYFDASGDVEKGRLIIDNAKTRRVSVCNALDTLIVHEQALSRLPDLLPTLAEKKVEIFADEASYRVLKTFYPEHLVHQAEEEDFGREFLALKMSLKTVSSVEQAVAHIKHFTSGHSEAIIANDSRVIDYFLEQVDAAAVYVNTSTAFTDGGQFGMGAEIGISTQKLHARGPMGLAALTSYKWLIWGNGQIRDH